MIRTLWCAEDLSAMMRNGHGTCQNAMNAINIYFAEHVYGNSGTIFHRAAVDEKLVQIVHTALDDEQPHLRGLYRVIVHRDDPADLIADLEVLMDDVYTHLVDIQPGAYLCH